MSTAEQSVSPVVTYWGHGLSCPSCGIPAIKFAHHKDGAVIAWHKIGDQPATFCEIQRMR